MSATAIPLTAGHEVPGPVATRQARQAALAELTAVGWPTRRREAWRYTDLGPLAAAGFDLVPSPASSAAQGEVKRLLETPTFGDPSRQLVLLDGQRIPGLGVTAIDGLDVSTPETRWNAFEAEFARTIAALHYPLAALNTAFTQHGLWLRIPAGTVAGAPIHVVVVGSTRSQVAAQPRIIIEVGEGAQATVVQHFVDCDPQSSGWTNCVTQLKQSPTSQLELYRFQHHGEARAHTSLLAAELAAGARLTVGYFDLGGRLVRNDIHIELRGSGARTELFGLFLAGAGQHVDDHTTISHAAGETHSRETFRGIIGSRGRGVFNGKVIVQPGCQRIDAHQSNDNLLLGEHAEVDTKPELEIYANDVKCSHGSTVGELDAEQLFYLRARGLDAAAARRLLTTAFAATVLEHIRDDALRSQALERVTARLVSLTET